MIVFKSLVFLSLWSMPYPAVDLASKDQSFSSEKWGFKINNKNPSWLKILASQEEKSHLVTFQKIENYQTSQARLNVRTDLVSKRNTSGDVSLKSYVEHWIQQFPKLGMEMLEKDYLLLNGKKAARIDSYNLEKKLQLRQYVVWTNKNDALIFSCSDKKEDFPVSLYACETILRSVSWNKEGQLKVK